MKTTAVFRFKTFFFALTLVLSSSTLIAQTIWMGGTPGHETDWGTPQNWSNHRVPGNFDLVVIPSLASTGENYPIITGRVGEIAHLAIHSGAQLTIKEGAVLTVDGATTFNYGIFNQGTIIQNGTTYVKNTGLARQLNEGNGQTLTPTAVFASLPSTHL